MTRRDLARFDQLLRDAHPLAPLIRSCGCGGAYLDIPAGLDSHEIVFSHRPHSASPPTNPADRGTSPAEHQSAAPQVRDPTTSPGHNDQHDD